MDLTKETCLGECRICNFSCERHWEVKSISEKKQIIEYANKHWQGRGTVGVSNNCKNGYLIITLHYYPDTCQGRCFGENDFEEMVKYIDEKSATAQLKLF